MTQFLRDQASDSEEVVRPLMLDGTYLSRNFATLGPLTWQPPCNQEPYLRLSMEEDIRVGRAGDQAYIVQLVVLDIRIMRDYVRVIGAGGQDTILVSAPITWGNRLQFHHKTHFSYQLVMELHEFIAAQLSYYLWRAARNWMDYPSLSTIRFQESKTRS